ncbi:MAG: VCBS repeat-containing protein, partial [Bacteroidales bacterium]|nr:VCBS repeat-containing protein [Bacteroidales bacterium]
MNHQPAMRPSRPRLPLLLCLLALLLLASPTPLHSQTVAGYPDNIKQADCTLDVEGSPWSVKRLGYASNVHCYSTPIVGDIDGDGIVEIVVGKYSGATSFTTISKLSVTNKEHLSRLSELKVFRGTDLVQIGTIRLPARSVPYSCPPALVRYPNAEGGMQGAVIVMCVDGYIRSYDINGTLLATSNISISWGYLSIADFNHDGRPEVYVSNHIFDAATLQLLCSGPSLPYSIAADVVGDNTLELIAGNTICDVKITSRTNPSQNSITINKTITTSTGASCTTVADLDHDGKLDVIVCSRNKSSRKKAIYAYNPRSGEWLFSHSITILSSTDYAYNLGMPMVGDIDGDGNPEIVTLDEKYMYAFRYKADIGLTQLWKISHSDWSGATGMTLFDFNQDGIMEIVYRDMTHLRIINGSLKISSSPYNLWRTEICAGTATEYPIVADVNNDGAAEIIVTGKIGTKGTNNANLYNGHLAVYAGITPWAPARRVWNQYQYNVTNINEDLTVPRYQFNNATRFTDPNGVVRQPFNNFLQQATALDRYGRPFRTSADLQPISATTYRDGANLAIRLTVRNAGDVDIAAPWSVSYYQGYYQGPRLLTQTVPTSLPAHSTATITLAVPLSSLCSRYYLDNLVIALNDNGTGIAQQGGQQAECRTSNNTISVAAPHHSTDSDTATACDSYTWNGTTYTASATPTHVYTSHLGCDSTVTLHLTINHSNTGDTTATACDRFTWHGTTYTTSGNFNSQFSLLNSQLCDSTVTLHLTINHSNTGDTTATACDNFTWHGNTYTTTPATAPTYTHTNSSGCDSLVTLHLTINNSNTGDTTAVKCDNFTWHGNTYTSTPLVAPTY